MAVAKRRESKRASLSLPLVATAFTRLIRASFILLSCCQESPAEIVRFCEARRCDSVPPGCQPGDDDAVRRRFSDRLFWRCAAAASGSGAVRAGGGDGILGVATAGKRSAWRDVGTTFSCIEGCDASGNPRHCGTTNRVRLCGTADRGGAGYHGDQFQGS